MELYIGISLVILSISILIGIIGIFKYSFYIDKNKASIEPTKDNTDNN